MLREHSAPRLLWDSLVLLLVVCSCLLVPYQVAFIPADLAMTQVGLLYLVDLVFVVDIGLNSVTSYRQQGVEFTAMADTRRHYARHMLPLDVMATFPFELILLLASGDQVWWGVSAVALLRLLRLLRIVRYFIIFRRFESLGWINPGLIRIVKFTVFIFLLAHWIACGWYFLSRAGSFPADGWVAAAGLLGLTAGDQYVRSLYWTITTMTTVGYGDITPNRTEEYLFASATMLVGASLYAFIIGSVASLLSNLQAAKSRYWEHIESVSEYLRYRGSPPQLITRVRDYYEYLWERYKSVNERALLEDMPESLRLEIMSNLAAKMMQKVPLFRYCSPTLKNVLLMSLRPQIFAPGSIILREGEVGKQICFMIKGEVEIVSDQQDKRYGIFGEGEYFGYLSLLLKEARTANIVALGYCDILILQRNSFEQINAEFPEFREVLNKVSAEQSEKMTELVIEGVVI